MSTEREMLEAAARAAGIDINLELYREGYGYVLSGKPKFWGPLANDSDSIRLAATLRISVEHSPANESRPWVCASVATDAGSRVQQFIEDVPDESQRADRMRLAILRCAAAQPPANGCERTESDANGCAEVQA